MEHLLTHLLVLWTIQADEGLLGVGIRHDRPLRHGDHAYLRCQARVYNGPARGAVRPWVIGEALLTGRARDAHRMVYGQLGIGNL